MLCETNKSTNASIVVGFKNRKQFKVKDKQDLINYLKQINEYYGMNGRARYGRSIQTGNTSQIFSNLKK